MSRPSQFTSAKNPRGIKEGSRKQELCDNIAGQDGGISLSSSNPGEDEEDKGEIIAGVHSDSENGKMGKEKGREKKDSQNKLNKTRQHSDKSKSKKSPKVSETSCHRKPHGEERGGHSEEGKRERGKEKTQISPSEVKPLSVKDRVKSIELYSKPVPPNQEENKDIEEVEIDIQQVDVEEDVNLPSTERDLGYSKDEQPSVEKDEIKNEDMPDKCGNDESRTAGFDRKKSNKNSKRNLPKTPKETADDDVERTCQTNDGTRPDDWREATVKELRGQIPSDSSSFYSEPVSSVNEAGYDPPCASAVSQAVVSLNDEALQGMHETPRYLYHDPEAALRLQHKTKKQTGRNFRQSVKKTTEGISVVSQVVMDWVRRKEEPSTLAQETPWLVNEKGASKADLMAKYKFFTSARLRYKARNMIGATGSRHINQRRRASIVSGSTMPLSMMSSSLGQVPEGDESRMANVPRRRVVDTSDLRTCAILQSRLKELKTYPE